MTTVTVTRIDPRRDNMACLGYVSVSLPELGIEVQGIRIIERNDSTVYAQLPNQRDYTGQWFKAVRFANPEVEREVLGAALEEWTARFW